MVETVDGVAHHCLFHLVPTLLHLPCVPASFVVERWHHVDVFQHLERCLNRNRVLDTVLPVLDQVALQQFVLLRLDAVLQRSLVVHRYFLIPALLAHHLLPSERVDALQVDAQVGKTQVDGRVLQVLRKVHTRRQAQK